MTPEQAQQLINILNNLSLIIGLGFTLLIINVLMAGCFIVNAIAKCNSNSK